MAGTISDKNTQTRTSSMKTIEAGAGGGVDKKVSQFTDRLKGWHKRQGQGHLRVIKGGNA